jgi:hypothetical protein
MDTKEIKSRIIVAGMKAVEELIKVAEAPIIANEGRTLIEDALCLISVFDNIQSLCPLN